MKRECLLCGKEFELIKCGYTRKYCFDCVPQYKLGDKESYRIAMKVKHNSIKKHLVDRLGGKCENCGYDRSLRALEFHHPNGTKEFGISAEFHKMEDYYTEVDKCRLLCANCHREEHEKLDKL